MNGENDLSERVLCSDETCIGIIDETGYCVVCQKPYSGDPNELPFHQLLKWSESPGWRERHLKRRYRNPLFPPKRRIVTLQELREAREQDDDEKSLVLERIDFLISLLMANDATIEDALKVLEELGSSLRDCQLCGLNSNVLSIIQFKDDFFAKLAKLSRNGLDRTLMDYDTILDYAGEKTEHNSLVLEITRIPKDDIVPTILSAEASDLRKVLDILGGTTLDALKRTCINLKEELELSGNLTSEFESKMRIIQELCL